MRLIRILGAIFSLSVRRELAFRTNLLFQLATTAISIAAEVATLGIVYTQTQTLAGWRQGDAFVLLGTFQVMGALLNTFISPNVSWFSDQVKDGKLDSLLLQPLPSIFQASLGSCSPLGLVQGVLGCIVIALGLGSASIHLTLIGLVAWLLLLICGIVIMWAFRVLIACIAFWAPGVELDVIYHAVWQFGRYPVSIYHQPLRLLLTYILPVAFIATFPAQALTRGIDPLLVALGILLSTLAGGLVLTVWQAGLRRYTSATS